MYNKALKEAERKLAESAKTISRLEQSLKAEKEKLQLEKQKTKSLNGKLFRRDQSQAELKESLSMLKKNFPFKA